MSDPDRTDRDRTDPDLLDPEHVCSAKGCRAAARWALRWNNPKIHTAERRKTWLACADHRDHLAGFLSARGFLRETEPFPPGSERH